MKEKLLSMRRINIIGFDGMYDLAENGDVISLPRSRRGSRGFYMTKERRMKPFKTIHGYMSVILRKDGKQKHFHIHSLLAKHFIPNPNNLKCINHRDGNKLNNQLSNLEWCDHLYNNLHALNNGLRIPTRGERHGRSKLNRKNVDEAKIMYKAGLSYAEIGRKLNVADNTIRAIITGRTWKDLVNQREEECIS